MTYVEFLKELQTVEFQESREDNPEYKEFIVTANHFTRLTSILQDFYGTAFSPPEERPSKQAKTFADPYGGIQKGQTLYYKSSNETSYWALLWPWGDGKSTTIKLFQGEIKGPVENGASLSQRIKKTIFG